MRVKGGMGEVEVPPYSNLSSPMKANNLAAKPAEVETEIATVALAAVERMAEVKYPRVESPTYTDLLCDQGSSSAADSAAESSAEAGTFIENVNYKIKMFKETTV